MKKLVLRSIGIYVNALSFFSKNYAGEKALAIFTKPRKGRINEKDHEFLSKAYQEEISFKDYEIMTYRWPGKGDTVLLAHGWESNSARWQFLIDQLVDLDFNVIALDAPSHGKSSGKAFNALLYSDFINVVSDKFKPEIIIGHSVGGMSSIFSVSKKERNSLRKMITLGAPSEFHTVLERYADMLGYNVSVRESMEKIVVKRFGHYPTHFSGAKFSSEIKAKGLIIHDVKDAIIPYSDALLYKSHFNNAQLISTEGFGHGLKQPKVSEHIIEFIKN
ncbi:alpha/beta hydrolase [Ichthyenterobacterium sp. W332]|uniref:Alpha/beta hydrolase n=1 Tax=Microcosmobacter mediterraneus TaxID=3075607 RepID=A0ABU2YNL3_9FLAO|nr:alpha/beta hydrolase [Ichthyenterobacterium sp. W332]MDT0559647.1 alpha/beta hydrolase [Ichthyenterobacterium sp. W332]